MLISRKVTIIEELLTNTKTCTTKQKKIVIKTITAFLQEYLSQSIFKIVYTWSCNNLLRERIITILKHTFMVSIINFFAKM